MSDDFAGLADIELEYTDSNLPFRFDFPASTSAMAADGAIPYGDSISSVSVAARSADGTEVSSELITKPTALNGSEVTVTLSYPSVSGPGRYFLIFRISTTNGSVLEFDFNRVLAEGASRFFTVFDLERELRIGESTGDLKAQLEALISAVSDLWDQLTNRKWLQTTHTEIHDNTGGAVTKLFLKNYPVTALTSLKVDNQRQWGAGISEMDPADYFLDQEKGIVYFDVDLPTGKANIRTIYQAGYTNHGLPASVKQILVRQTCHWYKQAKNAAWNIASVNQPDGGSINFNTKMLNNNLLPEFTSAAGKHKRPNV